MLLGFPHVLAPWGRGEGEGGGASADHVSALDRVSFSFRCRWGRAFEGQHTLRFAFPFGWSGHRFIEGGGYQHPGKISLIL